MKDIDADYYGYRDDDDGILFPLEQKDEEEYRNVLIKNWERKNKNNKEMDIVDNNNEVQSSQMHIPSQTEIQEVLLLHKKQELLDKYV
jgi:pre-mRNA-splicing factor ISY1